MRTLDDVRADFDDVDAQLIVLIARRQQLAIEAGAIKRAAGRQVVDAAREAKAKQARHAMCGQHGTDHSVVDVVEAVFAVLIAASRDVQR